MDSKKRLNRTKQLGDVENKTPQKVSSKNSEGEFMDYCVSPDFPSSQECFTVGWDWSGQVKGDNQPTIRVVQRPVRKRKETELLECHRPRRIVRNYDPDIFDTSSFVDQLKSLASGLKRVPESNSPVASSPHSSNKSRGHLVITPTSLRSSLKGPSSSTKVGNSQNESSSAATPTPQTNTESENSLKDLLDESIGADLVEFTQQVEQDLNHNHGKTPKPSKSLREGHSSSKKKSRLSLSNKKETSTRNNVCRRIDDVYEDCTSKKLSANCKENNNSMNNNCVPLGMDLDDFDEILLSINEDDELGKKVMVEPNKPSREINFSSSTVKLSDPDKNPLGNFNISGSTLKLNKANVIDVDPSLDDDFVSPDLLVVLDQCEKKATQSLARLDLPGPSSHKEKDLLDWITEQHETTREILKKKEATKNHIPSLQRGLCAATSSAQNSTSAGREKTERVDGQHKKTSQPDVVKDTGKNKNQPQCPPKSLSLTSGVLKCTPEEIEKKRQEARKRLTLKKRQS